MKRLPAPAISVLLLGLLALLLFGNCGGGVWWTLYSLPLKKKRQLRHAILLNEQARRAARQQHGAARRQALRQAEAAKQQRIDSLKLDEDQYRKTQHRWRKIGRKLPAAIRRDSLWELNDSLRRQRPQQADR